MKKLIQIFTLALITAVPSVALAQNNFENDPAYLAIDGAIDLKTIKPEVNVNLPRFLLQDALSDFNGGPDDPLAISGVSLAELVKDIKLIRVVVIESTTNNRAALDKGVAALRSTLETKWIAIASVPEENVGVYALGDPAGESIAGLAVLINNGGNVVIGNIVGHVSISKIIKAAMSFDKFPKDILNKFMKAENPEGDKTKPAAGAAK